MDRVVPPAGGHRRVPMRADEATPAAGTQDAPSSPCPEDTESLIPWLRKHFPETSPRTSDPRVIDACIARSAVVDLINYIEAQLAAAREDKDNG